MGRAAGQRAETGNLMSRSAFLGAALAATLLLCGWLALQPEDPPAVAALAPRAATAQRAPEVPAAPGAASSPSSRAAAPGPRAAPTARPRTAWADPPQRVLTAWGAPPPVARPSKAALAAAAAASAPVHPPPPRFPYSWIGLLDDGRGPTALLNGPQRSFGVRAGDLIDASWRVETVAATRLQLTWLAGGDGVTVEAR
jgi:hypothetical protein